MKFIENYSNLMKFIFLHFVDLYRAVGTKVACPIHGNVPCRCDQGGKPRAGPVSSSNLIISIVLVCFDVQSLREEEEEEVAKPSSEYPVTIIGKLETGV